MPAPSSTYSQALATSLQNYITKGKFADNVYEGLRTLQVMIDLGGKVEEEGGEHLVVQLEYARNATAGWIGPYGTYNTNPQDTFTAALFNWRQQAATVILTDEEAVKNSGPYRVANLLELKIRNAQKAMRAVLQAAVFNDGTNALAPIGLQAIVATTGTLGGISRTDNSWWRGNVESTAEVLSVPRMETMFNDCTHNLDRPQAIVTTQTLYEKYGALAQNFQELTHNGAMGGTADVGFEHYKFKGVPLWWDDDCPSGCMFFLNFNYLKLHCHKDWEFVASDPQRPANQPLWVHPVQWFGAICPSNCRMLGLLSAKTAT